ncbi:MAG TPA: LPS export ABC transporter permease LptG [Desulfuromonadales bacterium]|nr:LPS export ABC transporter permease LptG [Desulfuromonadales bacterium]
MGILSRYIARTWARLMLLCLSGFISVYLVIDLIEKVPRFIRSGGTAGDMLLYFICKLPEMLGRTATFSTLMATLLALGMLSRDSEIVAMRSCGVSLPRIAMPMLALGLVASLLLLVNAELVLPKSYELTEQIDKRVIKKQAGRAVFKRNNIWFRSDTQILQAQLFDPVTSTLSGVVIWSLGAAMSPLSRTDAEAARFADGRWTLLNAVTKDFAAVGGYNSRSSASLGIDLKLKVEDLRILDSDADNMSFMTLKSYADNLKSGGYQAYRYLTLMHSKLAAPFAALIMVLLGIPFALRSSRSGGIALGIGASVAIGFAYFVVNAVLLSYGRSGAFPPLLAAWGANGIFLVCGIWLAREIKN